MSLVNYSFTAIIDEASTGQNRVASQSVRVAVELDDSLATIYSDEAGTSPITQPGAQTNSNGVLEFWVEAGIYTIESGSRTEIKIIDNGSRLDVDTTSALTASKHLRLGDKVTTADHTTGNGGGGTYDIVANALPNAYNGIDILNIANDLTLLAKLRVDGLVNVNQLGIVGDDSTDNSAAWAGVDLLEYELEITEGIYRSTSNVTITSDLVFRKNAIIKPISSLFTINGVVQAGGYKIFDLSGVVEEEITATASQTVFSLANQYVIGERDLFVYYNNMAMDITTGYTETTTTSITTTFGIPVGVVMKFVVGGVQFGTARNDFVDVSTGDVHPEWWGATGYDDLSVDDTDAVQAALNSSRPYKALKRYNVTQVVIDGSEKRIDFDNYALMGTSSSHTSVCELKTNASKLYNLRADCQFNTNYEAAFHWYTNLLSGVIAGVFGYQPGNTMIFGIQADSAKIGLNIGALPSQSAAAQPAQNSSTYLPPTAINAPLSESHVFGFRTENCLNPVRMRQGNGKVTFTGSIASPNFGAFSTALPTVGLSIAGVDGGEIQWVGGAVENVVDTDGYMIYMENGNLRISSAIVEGLCTSYIAGYSRLSLSQLGNFGLNSNTIPFFAVQYDHTGEIMMNDFQAFMPANRFDAGTQPFIKSVLNSTLTFEPSLNLNCVFSNVVFQDTPWNDGGSQYMQPVLGGRARYSNCTFESIPSAGAARDQLFRLNDKSNLLSSVVDVSANTITAYANTANATSGGWDFSVSTASNSWGSNTTTPTIELSSISKAVRLTSVAGQECKATSPFINVSPSESYTLNSWMKTTNASGTVRLKAAFFRFDGVACTTTESMFLGAADTLIGSTYTPVSGVFKAPEDCAKIKIIIVSENGADIHFSNPSVN